jgi:hypothetical protein
MVEIGLDRFYRVDRAFAERLHARGGRHKGIEQGELDKVPTRAACLDKAACLGSVDGNPGMRVDVARELAEIAAHEVDELSVQFHHVNPRRAVMERL